VTVIKIESVMIRSNGKKKRSQFKIYCNNARDIIIALEDSLSET
jgi:hypothetical protein